jgi:hypothetical protein
MILKSQLTGLCLITTIFILIFTPGCSLNNSPDTTPVTIDLGLNENGSVRSISGKDAALSDVTAISVTVSGPGMESITEAVPLTTGSVILNVPIGKARLFQVTAARSSGNLGGSATADLEAGTPAELTISMAYQYTDVTININYPDGTPASSSLTYTLNVTNSGVTVNHTFSSSGDTIQVGSGEARDIEVLVETPSVTFRGSFTNQNLPGNGTASFNADVTLYETKIVIPDYSNNRIVQIDDETGATWIERNAGTLNLNGATGLTSFGPHDVDFDNRGRLYIANFYGGSGMGHNCVLRMDDIYGEDLMNFSEASYDNGVTAIAVDRNNNYVYYSTNSTTLTEKLYRSSYDNNDITSLSVQGGTYEIGTIRGMAVDDSGMLFLAGADSSGNPRIFRYNPSNQTVENQSTITLNTPWDTVVKSTGIYCANYVEGGGSIIQIDSDLNYINDLTEDPGTSTTFNGPHRFLAILNRKFYIIDETEWSSLDTERLVIFDDFATSWTFFDPSMVTETDFEFYINC